VMLAVTMLISAMTSRIRMHAAAAAEHDARVRAESMRTSLLSAVSHDLRTPLASISGAASTLRSHWGQLDEQTQVNLLDSITDETEHLNRLLHNLIEATRLEAGVQLQPEWLPLEEVVGSALHRLESQLSGRKIETDVPSSLPMVAMDDVLIEQVFINLVENSVKYTPPDSSIEIAARLGPGVIEIHVRDRGPGFAPGNEKRVFDRFFRGQTDNIRGAGLGLAICRAIVEAHGGTISAENRTGGGATVRFTLPLTDPPRHAEIPEPINP